MSKSVFSLPLLALLAGCATSSTGAASSDLGLSGAEKALADVMTKICVPAVRDGASIREMAGAQYMAPFPARSVNAPPSARVWLFGGLSDGFLEDWGDGSCKATVRRGDGDALRATTVKVVQAVGIEMRRGADIAAVGGGVIETYCSADDRPFVMAFQTPMPEVRSGGLYVTLARVDTPMDYCPPS